MNSLTYSPRNTPYYFHEEVTDVLLMDNDDNNEDNDEYGTDYETDDDSDEDSDNED